MATIFLKATSDVDISSGVSYFPVLDGPPAWPLLQTTTNTKGVNSNNQDSVGIIVEVETMPPASAVASVTVIANYEVTGGGGVVYNDASVSLETNSETHFSALGGLFLTFGAGGDYDETSLREFSPTASPKVTTITAPADFASGASGFKCTRYYVVGVTNEMLTGSNDPVLAATLWKLTPCVTSVGDIPDHLGVTYTHIDEIIQFGNDAYICVTDAGDAAWSVYKYDGAAITHERVLAGHPNGMAVYDGTLCVFNGTDIDVRTSGGVWSRTATGVSLINRNTLCVYEGAAGEELWFAGGRVDNTSRPNIYSWDGAAVTTFAPATTGIDDDSKVVVLSISSISGALVFITSGTVDSWGDPFPDVSFGIYWYDAVPGVPGGPAVGWSWDPIRQTITSANGFTFNDRAAPLAPFNNALWFGINPWDGAAAEPVDLYTCAGGDWSYGLPVFTIVSTGIADTELLEGISFQPSYSVADATGLISWGPLTTVPCTGVAWTETSVNNISGVGFHLDEYLGSQVKLLRLGIEVDYTAIPPLQNNKGCLSFLVS